MNNVDEMIHYLREAIQFQTASDIYELPREEFVTYVNRCKAFVVPAAIPHVVLFMLEEERNSLLYKIKKLLRLVKKL